MQSKLTNLTPEQFSQLLKDQLDINLICLFEFYLQGIDIDSYTTSTKYRAYREALIRRGFIGEDNRPTVQGKEYYESIVAHKGDGKALIKAQKSKLQNAFDLWWVAFPGTDAFEVGTKKFMGTRSLRTKKEACLEKFSALVNSGEYTADEIILATRMDVETRKGASIKLNANKLSFINNSLTYLNQKVFDPYVEKVRAGQKAPDVSEGPRRTFTL